MHLQKFELGETVIIPEQKSWPPHPAAVGVVVSNSYEEWAQLDASLGAFHVLWQFL